MLQLIVPQLSAVVLPDPPPPSPLLLVPPSEPVLFPPPLSLLLLPWVLPSPDDELVFAPSEVEPPPPPPSSDDATVTVSPPPHAANAVIAKTPHTEKKAIARMARISSHHDRYHERMRSPLFPRGRGVDVVQLPTPPHVANGGDRPQSPMLSLEHIDRLPLAGHPDTDAFGSQSCAAFCPHDVPITHEDVTPPMPLSLIQQIEPAAQFA
jgi:hypothetical protein